MGSASYYRSEQLEVIHLKDRQFEYPEHNHVSVYTIGLILAGEITLKSNGISVAYPSHSYFIVAPYQTHALAVPSTFTLLSICVNKNLLSANKPFELFGILSAILPQFSRDIDYTLLAEAVEDMFHRKVLIPEDNAIFKSALSIWKNPENITHLQVVANEACYSLYHFIKIFRRHVGMTPHKFLVQNRVRKAQRMIETGEMNADVTADLGFYDQSHFIKCFKNIVGLTPTEYRKAANAIRLFSLAQSGNEFSKKQ